jgi:hypothetical protein
MPNISTKYFRIKVTVSPIAPVVVAQKPDDTALLYFEDAGCRLERFPNECLAAWQAPRGHGCRRGRRGPQQSTGGNHLARSRPRQRRG